MSARRLQQIADEIRSLADEALALTRSNATAHSRAKAYWYPHIVMALGSDHDYLGSDGSTIAEAVELLGGSEGYGEDEDEEEE
jgi:hypothetical protein